MVPSQRHLREAAGSGPRRTPERELLLAVAEEFRRRGYQTYVDPDGTDYFDLAVRHGDEVGLIEGKVGAPVAVLEQALVRRAWADWVAVVVGSERGAERLLSRTNGRRAAIVGIWSCVGGRPRELRAATRTVDPSTPDPFTEPRARLRSTLLALDRGELPSAVRWSGIASEIRHRSGGRRFREWRLDESVVGSD